MKAIHLILFLSVIVFNEIVVEMLVSDEHTIALFDGSSEEKAESNNTELEGEKEVEFINDFSPSFSVEDKHFGTSSACDLANVLNPYIEIHSPPPESSYLPQ